MNDNYATITQEKIKIKKERKKEGAEMEQKKK